MKPDIQIIPHKKEIALKEFRGETTLEIRLNTEEELVLSVDIYSFQPQNHPENHLGWWHFILENGSHHLRLELDFAKIDKNSARAFKENRELESTDHWVNPDYELTPLQECKFVFWNKKDEIRCLKRILLKIDDRKILESFYQKQYAEEGYSPDAPFLDLLHHYKLKILKKFFHRYFRGRVLDVGCGLSLFTAFEKKWPFDIVAGDIVFDRMKERKREWPGITWIVFDASFLPFKAGCFDSVFAGEILEHLPDTEQALKEWSRIQRKDGMLIVTTPNRERRINRTNRENWPTSPDHLRELSFDELNHSILPRSGYTLIRKKGIYLELFSRSNGWWREDYLQREGNKKKNRFLMKSLFRFGYWFPKKSLDLISVAKKHESSPLMKR
jgi:SAM-dependent methyltransferase